MKEALLFGKKEAKNLGYGGACESAACGRWRGGAWSRSFLLLFFKKEVLLFGLL
jgi:hypothetical protein